MVKKKAVATSWWSNIQDQLSQYPQWIVESGIALGAGLVVGFVCRNFGRALFYFCVSALITICLLEYANMISIQAPGLRALFKNPDGTVLTWLNAIVTYVQARIFATTAFIIGFLFGWKLGQ